jgi:hypothetical protein
MTKKRIKVAEDDKKSLPLSFKYKIIIYQPIKNDQENHG